MEAVGKEVEDWKVGDRAGIPWMRWACGRCRECIEGWEALCRGLRGAGYDDDGCWAEYAVCPAKFAGRIPESLAWEEAAPILCAGVTSYKAVRLSGTRPGRTLGVFGIGGLGHMGLQYGKVAGGRVIAIDVNSAKLTLAAELGADACVDASGGDAIRALRKAGGIDDAVVFATARSAIQDALEALNINGKLIIASMPSGAVSVDAPDFTNRGITLTGTSLGSRQDLAEALAIGAGGRVRARVETCRMEDANGILKEMREHRLDAARKVIII